MHSITSKIAFSFSSGEIKPYIFKNPFFINFFETPFGFCGIYFKSSSICVFATVIYLIK